MILSSREEIDNATELFVRNIHIAADSSTCRQRSMNPSDPHYTLLKPEVRDLVRSKRALRRRFMRSRDLADKRAYRRAEDDLKKLLHKTKNEYFADLLRNAGPTKTHGLNLWKAAKAVKRQPPRRIPVRRADNTWCRSDSEISLAFADELEDRFQPFDLAKREVEATIAY
ncbi:hypothetical protein KR032_007806, partial [Drosophila birchii]